MLTQISSQRPYHIFVFETTISVVAFANPTPPPGNSNAVIFHYSPQGNSCRPNAPTLQLMMGIYVPGNALRKMSVLLCGTFFPPPPIEGLRRSVNNRSDGQICRGRSSNQLYCCQSWREVVFLIMYQWWTWWSYLAARSTCC